MMKTMKKAFMLGVGATALTKEHAENFSKELVKKGEISKKEAKKLVSSMMKEASIQEKKLRPIIKKEAKMAVKRIEKITQKETKALAKRVALLEKKLMASAKKTMKKKQAKKKPVKRKSTKKKATKRKKK